VRRNELTIGLSVAALAAIVAFWLLALAPKRQEASSLKEDVDQLHSQLAEDQQAVAAGEQARRSFPDDYRKLVVLGKAVPADGDQASLLVQLQQLADKSGVSFQSIDLSDTTSSAASGSSVPPPTSSAPDGSSTPASSTSSSPSTDSSASSTTSTTTTSTTTTAAAAPAATEASAAALPIGASIGPAGLPVMPYDLTFTGDYFQIADFMKSLNGLVHLRHGAIDVTGRLLTVDAFTLAPIQSESQGLTPIPTLTAELSVTTYLTPDEQGLTGGATPTGPAPSTATPASAVATPAPGTTATSSTPTSTPSSTASATTSSP
jgi:Tfp pilus assembly protein PilO